MKFTELALPGVWLIDAEPFADERGVFRRHFCADEFAAHGIAPTVAQGNISENPVAGTLRGFHFQTPPHEEPKTLSCLAGGVYDIVVDLRRDSPTFLKWAACEFSASNRRSLHVPAGCANAWLTTEPNTLVHYYMGAMFAPGFDRGIRYDDPLFGFQWPSAPVMMSDKDRAYPDFDPASLEPA
ncbi:MAG TPA: dTDP-4-dehydrorhamnose 3,5-epimerase family protein [Caulobacteraceae bacterium]|jgi:dTDP-4-dehydrorhamnose 3,5-epimerase